jgi:hypothetical protein
MTSIEEKLIGRISAQLTRAVEEANQAYEFAPGSYAAGARLFVYRRQKLVRQLRRASTDNEVRFALKRTAESLARIGVPLATIDAQIRPISLMTRRQMWSCRPGGAA